MRESSRWEKNGENNPSHELPVWAPDYLIKREIILFLTQKMVKRWHKNAMVTWILLLSAFCLGTPEQICKGDAWNLHENGVGIYFILMFSK